MKACVSRFIPGKLYRIKQEAPSAPSRTGVLVLILEVVQVAPTHSDCRAIDNTSEVYELFLWYDDWEELDVG
jgi:hypothetical protein